MIGYLDGMKVIESTMLTKTKWAVKRNPRMVRRSRLCKRAKIRPVRAITVPSTEVIVDENNNCMYMHPATARALSDQIQKHSPVEWRMNAGFSLDPGFIDLINPCRP